MKTLQKFVTVIVFLMALQACQKDEAATELLNSKNLVTQEARMYNPPWVYVMDWRFSRETCATGPGVCFKNNDGDIFVNGDSSTDSSAEVKEIFLRLLKDNTDEDNGVIAFRNEKDFIRLAFSRSLEEDSFIISKDVSLREDITLKLNKKNIILLAGEYALDYSRFKNGEVLIPVKN